MRNVSFGVNTRTLTVKICVPCKSDQKWEVLLILPTTRNGADFCLTPEDFDPTQVLTVTASKTHARAKIVDKILEIHKFVSENDNVNLVKGVYGDDRDLQVVRAHTNALE